MRYVTIIIFLVVCSNPIYAQQLSFSNSNLVRIFHQIEGQTLHTFNYDPKLVSKYTFSGTISLSDSKEFMQVILKHTPLTFEVKNKKILVFPASKKQYRICGYIKKTDGTPVSNTNVYLKHTTLGTVSDSKGYFSFQLTAIKHQKIIISHIEFETQEITVNEWSSGNCKNIRLLPQEYRLKGVTLHYILKGITEGIDYSATSIHTNALFKHHTLQETDVLKVAQLLPGISSIDESAAHVTIRGSNSDQNLIVWEGATLYNSGHVLGMSSSINPFVVQQMNIYKSVHHPKYDNRVGGIIDISLPDRAVSKIQGGIGTTLADSYVYMHTPIVKNTLSFLVAGRTTTNGTFNSPVIRNYSKKIFSAVVTGEESSAVSVGFKNGEDRLTYSDINGKLIYTPSKRFSMETAYFRSEDNTNFLVNTTQTDIQSNEAVFQKMEALSFTTKWKWKKGITSKFFATHSNYSSANTALFSNSSENNFSFQKKNTNTVKEMKLGMMNDFKFARSQLTVGYTFNVKDVGYSLDQTSSFFGDIVKKNRAKGIFHNWISSFQYNTSKYDIKAGLRSTYYQEFGQWFVSPRLHVQYRFQPTLKFKGSAGVFHQFINQIQPGNNQIINSRNNLWILPKSETGNHLSSKKIAFGAVFTPDDWLFDVEAYYHKTTGIANLSNLSNPQVQIDGTGNSTVLGLDILMKRKFGNYNFWANYTLSRNMYSGMFANYEKFPAYNDQRHNLTIFNTYKLNNWSFSLNYSYKSGLPFSKPLGIVRQGTTNRLEYGKLNQERLPSYIRLDTGISYRKKFWKEKVNVEVNFSILNLLNRTNRFSKSYFIGDGEATSNPQINSIETFQLRRTPQLLLKLSF